MAATSSAHNASATTTNNSNNNLMTSSPQDSDAWALLSLKDSNNMPSPTRTIMSTSMNSSPMSKPDGISNGGGSHGGQSHSLKSPLAKISNKDFDFLMKQNRIIIGRHSSTRGEVDINMGHSSFISRKHIEIFHEDNGNFFLICNGKNGVFVDGAFQCKGGAPLPLAKS